MNRQATIIRVKVLIANARRALKALEAELQSIIDKEDAASGK